MMAWWHGSKSEEQLTSTPSRLGIAWSSLGGSRKHFMTPSPVTAQARVKSVFGDVRFLLQSWMIILAVFFSLNDQGNIQDFFAAGRYLF
jgi:hypothetical protein